MQSYDLITDGSALAYANCGGWAYLLQGNNTEKIRSGVRYNGGSNLMELFAIVEGLSVIAKSSRVLIFTDSFYVINGILKQKHTQYELWQELYLLLSLHEIRFIKIGKGKSDVRHDRVHHLAREALFYEIQTNGSMRQKPNCNLRTRTIRNRKIRDFRQQEWYSDYWYNTTA